MVVRYMKDECCVTMVIGSLKTPFTISESDCCGANSHRVKIIAFAFFVGPKRDLGLDMD